MAAGDILRAYRKRALSPSDRDRDGRITSVEQAESLFPGTTTNLEYRRTFSGLLDGLADHYQFDEEYEDALPLYSAAWLLDNDNTESAVDTAAILNLDPDRYDPDREIVEALTQIYAPYRTGWWKYTANLFKGDPKVDYDRQDQENLV